MINSTVEKPGVLILGIGNVLMGDEGIGVHVVQALEKAALPADIIALDGGVGGFLLLEPMQNAEKVIIVDAAIDGGATGTVRRIRPRFSTDYPTTLTAHDIGLKDLLDVFYIMGQTPDVTLFAVSIPPLQDMTMELSPALKAAVPEIVDAVIDEALTYTKTEMREAELCV